MLHQLNKSQTSLFLAASIFFFFFFFFFLWQYLFQSPFEAIYKLNVYGNNFFQGEWSKFKLNLYCGFFLCADDDATNGTHTWIGKGLTCVCFKRRGNYERICINLTPLQASIVYTTDEHNMYIHKHTHTLNIFRLSICSHNTLLSDLSRLPHYLLIRIIE